MEKKYNLKSPAVKRLMREAMELKDPTHQYHAQPLEHDLFEWHFTVRGPPDTEFAGGQYHGRITFPAEYPMKPPNIILLTPNGRFEVGKKICLSMSAHHPETWQPSWSLRTVLLALIGFMPTKGAGAIGALDYTPEERKVLAARSCDWKCDACGIDHQSCLLEADPISTEHEKQENEEAKELASHFVFKGEGEKEKKNEPNKDIPSAPVDESTDQISSQLNGVENIQENLTEPDTALRQRVTATTTADGRSNSANSQNVPDETNMNNQTAASSMADHVSLILLWVVAALLVIVILKRLSAGESSTISKSNY